MNVKDLDHGKSIGQCDLFRVAFARYPDVLRPVLRKRRQLGVMLGYLVNRLAFI